MYPQKFVLALWVLFNSRLVARYIHLSSHSSENDFVLIFELKLSLGLDELVSPAARPGRVPNPSSLPDTVSKYIGRVSRQDGGRIELPTCTSLTFFRVPELSGRICAPNKGKSTTLWQSVDLRPPAAET